ncbi:MAG: hypothetical protein IKQ97_03935, partial [Eubacterium sp.]|nr:hypothetical protein [Eubacterium sp.]
MKRLLKPIIITTILMLILGGAAFFFLKNSSDTEVVGEFHTRRDDDQSDQTDSHAFRSDMKSLAVDLVRQGEEKNVLNFVNVVFFLNIYIYLLDKYHFYIYLLDKYHFYI